MGKVIAAAAYSAGRKVQDIAIGESGEWAARPGHFVWIGIHEPDERELRAAAERSSTCTSWRSRTRCTPTSGRSSSSTARPPSSSCAPPSASDGHIVLGETEIFVGRGYIISVRHGASASYARVRQCAEAAPSRLANGEDYVLYAIIDFIVDNYLAVDRPARGARSRRWRRRSSSPPRARRKIARIYELRRELQRLRLVVAPTAEVCRRLEHADLPGIDPSFRPYYRDIVDHLNRVLEQIDTLREMLSFAFEASLLHRARRGRARSAASSPAGPRSWPCPRRSPASTA